MVWFPSIAELFLGLVWPWLLFQFNEASIGATLSQNGHPIEYLSEKVK